LVFQETNYVASSVDKPAVSTASQAASEAKVNEAGLVNKNSGSATVK
jgi:hypothetical protein